MGWTLAPPERAIFLPQGVEALAFGVSAAVAPHFFNLYIIDCAIDSNPEFFIIMPPVKGCNISIPASLPVFIADNLYDFNPVGPVQHC